MKTMTEDIAQLASSVLELSMTLYKTLSYFEEINEKDYVDTLFYIRSECIQILKNNLLEKESYNEIEMNSLPWINVDTLLPKEGQFCFLYGHLADDPPTERNRLFNIGYYEKGLFHFMDISPNHGHEFVISHWMKMIPPAMKFIPISQTSADFVNQLSQGTEDA